MWYPYVIALVAFVILVLWLTNGKKENLSMVEIEVSRPYLEDLLNRIHLGEDIPGVDGEVDPDSVIAVYSSDPGSLRVTPAPAVSRELFNQNTSVNATYSDLGDQYRNLYYQPDTWYPYYQLNPSFVDWPEKVFSKFYYWGPAVTSGWTWAIRPGAFLSSRPPRAGWVRHNSNQYYFLNNSGFD